MNVKFTSRIPKVLRDSRVRTTVAVAATTQSLKQDMVARVAVDEGTLRDSIEEEKVSDHESRVNIGNAEAFYPHLVEFGTTKTPARPFIIPAVERGMGAFIASMKKIA